MAMVTIAAAALPAAAEVQVQKQGDDFVITTEVYEARISGKTGLLDGLSIGEIAAVEGMEINLDKREFEQVNVIQQGPDRVEVQIAARQGEDLIEDALVMAYQADPTTLTLTLRANVKGTIAGRGPRFTIGREAQMCRSLDYREAVPIPSLQGQTPWTRVKYYYSSGATMGLLNSGSGNPYNPNENGQVGQFIYARGGYVPNSDYTYTFICEAGDGQPTLGSPPMKVLEAATPAVYWQGDPIEATLQLEREHYEKLAGLEDLHVAFEVEDAFEQVVSTGRVPLNLEGDMVEVKVPLGVDKLGWYRAYFRVTDADDSLLEGRERLLFSVLKRMPHMGESFDNQIQTDYTIGLGRIRLHPGSPDKVAAQIEQARQQAEGTDVMVSWQIDSAPREVGMDPKKFGEFVGRIFESADGGIERIEIINEPDGNYQPREYIDSFLRPAYEAIKAISPETKVIGPVTCGIAEQQQSYVEQLYALGLKDVTDELSFHPYAGNFDDGEAVNRMRRLKEIIAANGDEDKKVHFTEAGYFHGGWSNVSELREIIKLAVSQYAWQDAVMGIDYRHNFYYFTDSMGYYNMWLRSRHLTPAAVALRQYTSIVKGQEQARQLNFGSLEAVRGFLYPGEQKQVVLLWHAGNRIPTDAADPTIQIQLETNADQVERFDSFGNPLEVSIADGKLDLEIGTFPTYLVLPADASVSAVAEEWGTNLALASLGAIAEASSEQGTMPAVAAIDGNTASGSAWRSEAANEFPQSLTVSLASPATIDRIGLWSYSARGYDVEVMDAEGNWKQVLSQREQPWTRFRNESIEPIMTDQVRVTIIDSHGSYAEIAELQLFSSTSSAESVGELANWALKSNGATAVASSEMVKEVTIAEQTYGSAQPRINKTTLEGRAENAIDGVRNVRIWQDFYPTTWMAAMDQELPQWLEIRFDQPRTIRSVTVYTIAFASWKPEQSGVRDWDVQVWEDGDWVTVDSVRDNDRVSKTTRIPEPKTTERIRILVSGTNDDEGAVGIMEVEAYGPQE